MNESGAELTVLDLKDMSRCLSCRRLVTLRRILSFGSCKCGARKVVEATFLDEDDLLEVEEDYGWDVKITGVGEYNVSKGLLPRRNGAPAPEGKRTVVVDEARLHSRRAGEYRAEAGRVHSTLARRGWWRGQPLSGRFESPAKLRDFLEGLKRPFYFFGKRDEGRRAS